MDNQHSVLYKETVHLILSVYRQLRQSSRQMHVAGISGRKIAMLRYLREAGPLTVGQIRDYLYVSDSSTSELVARLEEKGFVQRSRSQADNRVVIVSITATGMELVERTPLSGMPLLRERLKAFPKERLATIKEAMKEIVRILEAPNV